MRSFQMMQIDEAYAHAMDGGQALHLHSIVFASSPACFRRAVARGEQIAHLFDQDEARLRRTARELGVRIIVVEHPGTRGQHVDLCGGPLRRALALCTEP
jgi:hypothetical protein